MTITFTDGAETNPDQTDQFGVISVDATGFLRCCRWRSGASWSMASMEYLRSLQWNRRQVSTVCKLLKRIGCGALCKTWFRKIMCRELCSISKLDEFKPAGFSDAHVPINTRNPEKLRQTRLSMFTTRTSRMNTEADRNSSASSTTRGTSKNGSKRKR